MKKWISPPISKELFTDSSSLAWGAVLNETNIGGAWSIKEKNLHIN